MGGASSSPPVLVPFAELAERRERSRLRQRALEFLDAVVPEARLPGRVAATARSAGSGLTEGASLLVDPRLDQVDVRLAASACAIQFDAVEASGPNSWVCVTWPVLKGLRRLAERGARATGETPIEWVCRELMGASLSDAQGRSFLSEEGFN
jgi:hypothetical protein